MFSGLVKEMGFVEKFSGEILQIRSDLTPQIGASIAVNGICTTVTSYKNGVFSVVLSKETRESVALENLQGRVHLEEALRLCDRLDGHIMQGHIDSVGEILDIQKSENGFDFIIAFPPKLYPLIVPKGSIAIDGISLTVNEVRTHNFRLTIIPHTFKQTLFGSYKPKRRVNIETDIINRSIFHIMQSVKKSQDSTLDSANGAMWQKIDSILMSY